MLSAPSVLYKLTLADRTYVEVDNPSNWPNAADVAHTEEPYIKASILVPERYMGVVMDLCSQHRAESLSMNYLAVGRVEVVSLMPLGEVLFDYYDKLKTITQGYGSFDWAPEQYRTSKIVKVDVERNLVYVHGAVPGYNNAYVTLHRTIKNDRFFNEKK